jgi:hypothetical protein
MINSLKGVMVLLITLISVTLTAQPALKEPNYNKPKLFADLPAQISVPLTAMTPLLELKQGEKVQLQLAPGFLLNGVVVSTSDNSDPSVKSVVIRSSSRVGATLTFTRTLNAGKTEYIGRMLSYDHSDAFEFSESNGALLLVKKHLFDLFNE